MLRYICLKKTLYLKILFRLIVQILFTFICALILYQLLKRSTKQLDIDKEYFPFGQETEHEQKKSNDYRLEIARGYLKNSEIDKFRISPSNPKEHVNLTISLIAAYRQQNYYLTQTLGYLLNELNSKNHQQKISILVCFVEDGPNKEVEELQRLGIDFLFLYEDRQFPQVPEGKNDERVAKESNDYWTCLKKTNEMVNSKYVLLLEDDSLPIPKFVRQIESLMDQLDKKTLIDYVKLFHPWNLRKIPSFFQIGTICGIISFLPLLFLKIQSKIYYFNVLLISFLLSFILFKTNHQLIADTRFSLTQTAYLTYGESCCTPAILFRSSSSIQIAEQLIKVEAKLGHAKDHLIDESNFVGKMTDRNLITHIGHFSAVRQAVIKFS